MLETLQSVTYCGSGRPGQRVQKKIRSFDPLLTGLQDANLPAPRSSANWIGVEDIAGCVEKFGFCEARVVPDNKPCRFFRCLLIMRGSDDSAAGIKYFPGSFLAVGSISPFPIDATQSKSFLNDRSKTCSVSLR